MWIDRVFSTANQETKAMTIRIAKMIVVVHKLMPKLSVRLSVISVPATLMNTTADLTLPFLGLNYSPATLFGPWTLTCILTNPFNKKQSTTVTSPVIDDKLFGDWMKNEWLFAIALPAAFIAGGAVLAAKK